MAAPRHRCKGSRQQRNSRQVRQLNPIHHALLDTERLLFRKIGGLRKTNSAYIEHWSYFMPTRVIMRWL
jgi:hypothetical protein